MPLAINLLPRRRWFGRRRRVTYAVAPAAAPALASHYSPDPRFERWRLDTELGREAAASSCTAARLRSLLAEWDAFAHPRRHGPPDPVQAATVERNIARHPNAPADVLGSLLARGCAAEFCANPAAPLTVLEAGALIETAGRDGLLWLLSCPDAPAPLVRLLASGVSGDEEVTWGACHHLSTAGEPKPDAWIDAVCSFLRHWLADAAEPARQLAAQLADFGVVPPKLFGDHAPCPVPGAGAPSLSDEMLMFLFYEQLCVSKVCLMAYQVGLGVGPPFSGPRPTIRAVSPSPRDLRLLALWSRLQTRRGLRWALMFRDLLLRLALLSLYDQTQEPVQRRLLLRHRCATSHLRERFLHAALNASRVGAVSRNPVAVMFAFVAHPRPDETSAYVLYQGAAGPSWFARLVAAVALPPSDPLLSRLAEDGIGLVRAAAKARLRGEKFAWPAENGGAT